MKKILLTFVLLLALSMLFTVSAFAYEAPEKSPQTTPSYDDSHDAVNDNCCPYPSGSGVEHGSHYEEGYYDGHYDGYQAGLESTELSEEEKQAFLSQYFESQDYKDRIAQAQEQAVNNYKNSSQFNEDAKNAASSQGAILEAYANGYNAGRAEYKGSDEYQSALQAQYMSGVDAGYQSGYNTGYSEAEQAVYSKGVAEGFVDFRESSEYKATLQSVYDGAYNEGYADGANDGQSATESDGPNWSSIITLAIGIITIGGLFLFVSIPKKKERKRK